jgi:hypothetical protein
MKNKNSKKYIPRLNVSGCSLYRVTANRYLLTGQRRIDFGIENHDNGRNPPFVKILTRYTLISISLTRIRTQHNAKPLLKFSCNHKIFSKKKEYRKEYFPNGESNPGRIGESDKS